MGAFPPYVGRRLTNTVQVPLPQNVPYFDQRVYLDGHELVFSFSWSARTGRWWLDVLAANGNAIVRDIKLVPGFPLWSKVQDIRLPLGDLLVMGEAPTLSTLGLDSAALLYLSYAVGP